MTGSVTVRQQDMVHSVDNFYSYVPVWVGKY